MKPDYWDRAKRALARRDPVMGGIMRAHPKVFLAPRGEPFCTLARAIVGQQISVKAAQSVWDRFVSLVDDPTTRVQPASVLAFLEWFGVGAGNDIVVDEGNRLVGADSFMARVPRFNPEMFRNRSVCCVVNGGNVDPKVLQAIPAG